MTDTHTVATPITDADALATAAAVDPRLVRVVGAAAGRGRADDRDRGAEL